MGGGGGVTGRRRELLLLFIRLGVTAFGGPAAHIAMMRDEVVRRRQWLSDADFLDLLAVTNLIPGPNSTELAIHIGRCRAGWPGLLIAGAAFILPAAIMVAALASLYERAGALPPVRAVLTGVIPVVIGIIVHALVGLGRAALTSPLSIALAAGATALAVAGVHELLVLAAAAMAAMAMHGVRTRLLALLAMISAPATVLAHAAATTPAAVNLTTLFLVFLKAGATLFGSGYVLLAFLRADLVERLGWLTDDQLLTAISIGQVTPGPVFTTATFIGWMLAGAPGAALATVAIFLPAFIFVAATGPIIPRLRRSAVAASMLDGLKAASLALMAVVTWRLAQDALVDPLTIALAGISTALLVATRINSAWLMLGGATAGLLWFTVGRA